MTAQAWDCCGGRTAESRSDEGTVVQEAKETNRHESSFACWDWCSGARSGDRRGGIRFGFLLILLGLLWLGGALGWLQAEILRPLTVIAIGLWLAFFSRIRWKRKN
jgi:hypothetical protein